MLATHITHLTVATQPCQHDLSLLIRLELPVLPLLAHGPPQGIKATTISKPSGPANRQLETGVRVRLHAAPGPATEVRLKLCARLRGDIPGDGGVAARWRGHGG